MVERQLLHVGERVDRGVLASAFAAPRPQQERERPQVLVQFGCHGTDATIRPLGRLVGGSGAGAPPAEVLALVIQALRDGALQQRDLVVQRELEDLRCEVELGEVPPLDHGVPLRDLLVDPRIHAGQVLLQTGDAFADRAHAHRHVAFGHGTVSWVGSASSGVTPRRRPCSAFRSLTTSSWARSPFIHSPSDVLETAPARRADATQVGRRRQSCSKQPLHHGPLGSADAIHRSDECHSGEVTGPLAPGGGPAGRGGHRREQTLLPGGPGRTPLLGADFGPLQTIRSTYDPDGEHLVLTFPDGGVAEGDATAFTDGLITDFYGRPVRAHVVPGPWTEALSAFVGTPHPSGQM